MKRALLSAALVFLLPLAGCGKKDDDKTQETPKGTDVPAVTCDKGQVAEGDKCVAVITPEKVEAVRQQASKLDEIQQKLDKIKVLAAPIDLMDAIRKLEAWQTAAKTSDKFKQVDEMIVQLKAGTDQLKKFNEQLKASKAKITDLGNTLNQIYEGTGAAKTLQAAKLQVSTELRAAIEPLQAQVVEAMKAIEPAFEELKKLEDILDAVCGVGKLSGAGSDFEKLCETGEEAFEKAVDFLEENKDAPRTILMDTVTALETQLDSLVTTEAKKLMDDAEAKVKELAGETGDEGDGDDGGDE
jgi:DNA repair exonuclease SbcCD ATPase subunit